MNKVIEGVCVDYTYDGKGIVKGDGLTVFVDGVILNEKVKVEIIYQSKNQTLGKVKEFISTSNDRVNPKCKICQNCGGCALQHMSYQAQLDFKKNHVKDCLSKIGHINIEVNETLGMENPYEYRNKTQVPFKEKKGKIKYGFYKEGKNEKYNPYLAVNDLLVYGSNFVCEYAETMQIVNKNVKSRSSVKDLSDVKFSIIDLYTRVVIETYSNITVDEEQYKVLENSENMDLMNKHFKIENSYVETKDDYSLNNLRFAEEYSSCDKQTFAQNLSENVKNISGITSTSTTLEKATFYFKQVYGIGG